MMLTVELGRCHPDILPGVLLEQFGPNAPANVRAVARDRGMDTNTLQSRVVRAGLPSLKQYIVRARLVRACALLEIGSVHKVAMELGYTSAQHFSRHVKNFLGKTPAEIRRQQVTGLTALKAYRDEMIVPHRETLMNLVVPCPKT